MADQRTLAATYIGALTIDTLGAVAPWSGGATLPKPSALAGTWTLWFILGLVAGIGDKAADLAGKFSVLVLASMVIIGPYGTKVTRALQFFAGLFAGNTASVAAAPVAPVAAVTV